jgi:hypothetical protein
MRRAEVYIRLNNIRSFSTHTFQALNAYNSVNRELSGVISKVDGVALGILKLNYLLNQAIKNLQKQN